MLDPEMARGTRRTLVGSEKPEATGKSDRQVQRVHRAKRRRELREPVAGQDVFLTPHGHNAITALLQAQTEQRKKAPGGAHFDLAGARLDCESGAELA